MKAGPDGGTRSGESGLDGPGGLGEWYGFVFVIFRNGVDQLVDQHHGPRVNRELIFPPARGMPLDSAGPALQDIAVRRHFPKRQESCP